MSPGCERITKTGAEVASAGEGGARRVALPQPPGNEGPFPGRSKGSGTGCRLPALGRLRWNKPMGSVGGMRRKETHLPPSLPSFVCPPSLHARAGVAASPASCQENCPFSGLFGPSQGLWHGRQRLFLPCLGQRGLRLVLLVCSGTGF